ncbi:MAG: TonB-dependent receptor domain-containing protein, partial [Gammaproteobacteria bacterium]
ATLEYRTFGGNRGRAGINLFEDEDFAGTPNGDRDALESKTVVFNAANNCGQASFPEPGFLSESRGGNNLITVAEEGVPGTGNTWATFDYDCLIDTLLANYGGASAIDLQNGIETSSVDLTEDTLAFYLQANYDTELFGKPIRGNFGVRVVETDIESVGYRAPLNVIEGVDSNGDPEFFIRPDSDADFVINVETNSYTEVLPSVTFVMDLNDDLVFRAGAFRGISRPDPHSYGNGRTIMTDDDTDQDTGAPSLEDAINISGPGNPQLEPLASWNLDIGLEWYANNDTLLAAGVYWKQFQGAFENAFQQEEFVIDGDTVSHPVRTTQVSGDKSTITGLEVTATHSFGYLPGWFLSGFGAKFSYNYADSDFEFEDGYGGDGVAFNNDGSTTQLIGILPPAGLWGLSKHTTATQIYWSNKHFNVQAIYKTRSGYFQGYGRDTQARVRYVDDYKTLDFRASYYINNNFTVSFEAINLLSEPRVDYRAIEGETLQTLEYGPRLFAGIKAKF